MRVRIARSQDFTAVIDLAERGYVETRYARYPFSRDRLEKLAALIMERPDELVLLVAEHNDEIVGFLCGLISDHYFAAVKYATSMALYVAPAHRGSFAAPLLVRRFEREARARGAAEVMLAVTSGVHSAATTRFYDALGYGVLGAVTVKYL